MSATYQLKFYQPASRFGREEVLRAVQIFLEREYEVHSFRLGFKFLTVHQQEMVTPEEMVAIDGTCVINLLYSRSGRKWPFLFQVFAPEAKGAQAMISIEDFIFDEEPDRAGRFLINMAGPLLEALGARFAWGDHEDMLRQLENRLSLVHLEALAWANFFSHPFIEQLGEEWLKGTPVHKMAALQSGWLLLTVENPTLPTSKEDVEKILQHWPGCQVREITNPGGGA